MRGRAQRLAAAMAVVFAVAASGLLASAGTAGATAPVVVGNCAATVQGEPGTPVQLSPSAVLEPVVNVVRTLDPLNLITPGVRSAVAAMPPIPIGAIPSGTGFITAGQITGAVTAELKKIPLLGPIIGGVVKGLQDTLGGLCGVTVKAVNTVGAVAQEGTAAVADKANDAARTLVPGAQQPGPGTKPGGQQPNKPPVQPAPGTGGGPAGAGGGQAGTAAPATGPNSPVLGGWQSPGGDVLSGWDHGRAPMTDYTSIPFAKAGLYAPSPGVRYGGGVPGYSPRFGILGTDTPPEDGVQAAGHAEAIGLAAGRDIDLSVLLAVLVLSGVTAALVRTWVLRRVAA